MKPENEIIEEAIQYLNGLYETTPQDRSGEDFIHHLWWHVKRLSGARRGAIIKALDIWLRGEEADKVDSAIYLIDLFEAVEYIPKLEKIYHDIHAGTSCLSAQCLPFVKNVISHLQEIVEAKR